MRLLFALLILTAVQNAGAYENKCVTRFRGYVAAKCPGKSLPSDRLRNFHHNSHQIVCTASADPYMRLPQKYDFVEWNDKRKIGKNEEAFNMRRELPLIQWTGRIPYQTIEEWSWEECVLGTSAYECGTYQVCQNVTTRDCDSDGKNCRDVSRQECHDVPKTCWYDETRHETMHCTNEAMNYSAEYVRPGLSEWNVNTHAYAEFLPNKYDLMPGEVEVVQSYNNNSRDPVLNPYLVVGDAWNKYDLSDVRGDAVGAACVPNRTYSFHAKIKTLQRDTSKASPNAFRLPVDENGKPIDPIANWFGNSKVRNGQPTQIVLDDTSAAVVKALADHSKDGAMVIAKAQGGKITNKDALMSPEALKQGFYKNTVVRVQLVKKNRYWFDRKVGWNIYNDDVKSVTASINAYSKEQEIMLSDKWEVDLMRSNTRHTGDGRKMDVYWKEMFGLKGDRAYAFRVSMYQRGVPFYKQDCKTDPRFGCTMPWPIGRSENAYFSKPMEVRFETHKDWSNNSWRTFMNNGGIGPGNLIRTLFEPLVSEPTKGENRE